MKKNVLKFISATAAALLLLLTPSCSGLVSPSVPDSPTDSDSQRYTLSGSFSMPSASAAPAELYTFNSNPRNAIPDTSSLIYTVEAKRNSDGHTETTTSPDGSTYTFTNLAAGTWQITAYATTGEGIRVMQSGTKSVTLSSATPAANASLDMTPASGSGNIYLTISWDTDKIGYCKWSSSDYGALEGSPESPSSPVTINLNGLATGTYSISLSFYTSKEKADAGLPPVYECTEYIVVYPGITTNKWTAGTAPHINASGNFSVTPACIESFVYRKIYVKQGANDGDATGTSERPFATIEKAMARLNEAASKGIRSGEISADTPWELHVSGTFTATAITDEAFIKVDSTVGNLAIIGEGSGATINANTKGRVLYVDSDTSVTIKSVTLTGGGVPSSIGRDTVYRGLCVYVATSGNLTMESGSSITGNTSAKATHGGGVYNEGTFTMNGGTISGNLARLAGPRDNQIGGDGGGVYNKGTFTMNDGTISTNKAMDGGAGVYNHSGTFTMNNGTISGNGVQEGSNRVFAGAGVMNRGTFDMYNGTISGNESTYMGGGVYNVQGTFTMHGGTISGNSAGTSESTSTTEGGGGVYAAGTVELLGGTITGNTVKAGFNGSGVYVNNASSDTFKMGGSAKVNSSNDVYLSGTSKIIISGALTATHPVATITPASYTGSPQVLDIEASPSPTTTLNAEYAKFRLPNTNYVINNGGIIADSWLAQVQNQINSHTGSSELSIDISSNITLNTAYMSESTPALTIPAGKNVRFTASSAKTIKVDNTVAWSSGNLPDFTFIKVKSGASLTIDSSITLQGVNYQGAHLIVIYTEGALVMNGAKITGFYGNGTATVMVGSGGIFTMNGGTISSCRARYGSAVYLSGGTFNFNAGSISGCINQNGKTIDGSGTMNWTTASATMDTTSIKTPGVTVNYLP